MSRNTPNDQSNLKEKSSGRSPAVLIEKPNRRVTQGTHCVLSRENDVLEHPQEETSPAPSMGAGGEVGGHHYGGKTTWVTDFSQELADLQNCLKEEDGHGVLLPNPFFQDDWVRGWERVPIEKPVIDKLE